MKSCCRACSTLPEAKTTTVNKLKNLTMTKWVMTIQKNFFKNENFAVNTLSGTSGPLSAISHCYFTNIQPPWYLGVSIKLRHEKLWRGTEREKCLTDTYWVGVGSK